MERIEPRTPRGRLFFAAEARDRADPSIFRVRTSVSDYFHLNLCPQDKFLPKKSALKAFIRARGVCLPRFAGMEGHGCLPSRPKGLQETLGTRGRTSLRTSLRGR